jgi:hypothetical protein
MARARTIDKRWRQPRACSSPQSRCPCPDRVDASRAGEAGPGRSLLRVRDDLHRVDLPGQRQHRVVDRFDAQFEGHSGQLEGRPLRAKPALPQRGFPCRH